MSTPVPVTVITGFLGSGKTTLLGHLLRHANGSRIALLINEFGEIGMDRDFLLGQGCAMPSCVGDGIIELANGCICCTVAEDFVPSMSRLLDDATGPPDHILIETSGLALPGPLLRAFNWPEIRDRVRLSAVITLVDGEAFEGRGAGDHALYRGDSAGSVLDHDRPLAELFADQMRHADLAVLSKADKLSAARVDELVSELRSRHGVMTMPVKMGALDPALILDTCQPSRASVQSGDEHEEDHDHDDFVSFTKQAGAISDPAGFRAGLDSLADQYPVLRIKGYVPVLGKPMRHVIQRVGSRRCSGYYDRPWQVDETRTGLLVVIGLAGLDQAGFHAGWQNLIAETAATEAD